MDILSSIFVAKNLESYAIVISGFAALMSAIAAIAALRISKRSVHNQVRPFIKVEYNFGDKGLKFSNTGIGPALNIRLQHAQVHYLPEKKIIRYDLSSNNLRTLYEKETGIFEISANKLISKDDLSAVLKDFNLYRFIETIGKKKEIGIIYDDLLGKSFILKVKIIEQENRNYIVETQSLKSYGIISKLYDYLDYNRFKITKPIREWKEPKTNG